MRALLLALICGALPLAAHARLEVVATLPDLAALAREVGGDAVAVTALVDPNEDPHYVDPKPSLVLPLNRADLLIVNGLELEVGWLPPLQVAARNGNIQTGADGYFDASSVVDRLNVPGGKVDRAQGDIHPGGNPHFVFDPRAAARIATALGDRMARLDPTHAEQYRANAKALHDRLDDLAERERARFAALPASQRQVVIYHDSLPYLADWLGLTPVAFVEPRPGIPPTPPHVAKVLQRMKKAEARVILQEAFYPKKTSETLARLAGGRVVVLEGGARFGAGDTYSARITRVAEAIHAALSR